MQVVDAEFADFGEVFDVTPVIAGIRSAERRFVSRQKRRIADPFEKDFSPAGKVDNVGFPDDEPPRLRGGKAANIPKT